MLSAIKSSPAPSYFEAIENLKGVQLLTSSLGFKVYNTRGFANPTNVRFVQLVDGADSQAPHIGAPIGSALHLPIWTSTVSSLFQVRLRLCME
jgi:iron complex outermembrane receptor protein